MMKEMMCEKMEVKLIRIPYTIKENDLEEYILSKWRGVCQGIV